MPHSPEQVLPRIFAALDDHRFEDLREFYIETVEAETVVGRLSGVEEVVGTLRRVHESIPRFQHLVSSVVVQVDGDEGTLRGNIVAVFCDAEHRPVFEGASVWRGRLHRAADGWRVAKFTMAPVWSRGTFPGA
jgi:hypothetical protein